VDATLGHGGHARALLEALTPGGHLYGFDRDAVELERSMGRICLEAARCLDREVSSGGRGPKGEPALFIPVHASFAELREVLDEAGLDGVDLILADLGLSSMQIDDPARGFSFKRRGPLDMRMDGSRGPTAAAWLESADEAALARALRDNADLEEAEDIARAVCLRRGRLATTRDLAEAVCSALPSLRFEDPATRKLLTRVFQAIRIEVNGEFSALATLLRLLPSCLNPGGRVAILSFHSGEERRVEEAFAAGLAAGHYASIAPEAIRPGREERNSNPRSVSASLRWARSPGAAGSRAYSGIHS
jgi:16S rRNA (cytosine1402-N4)-methyltransferase